MATHKFRILARIFQALLRVLLALLTPPRLRANLPEVTCPDTSLPSSPFPLPSPTFLPFRLTRPPLSLSLTSSGISLVLSACTRLTLSLSLILRDRIPKSPPDYHHHTEQHRPRRLSNCSTLRLNYLKSPPPTSSPSPLKLVSDRREKNDASVGSSRRTRKNLAGNANLSRIPFYVRREYSCLLITNRFRSPPPPPFRHSFIIAFSIRKREREKKKKVASLRKYRGNKIVKITKLVGANICKYANVGKF